MPTGPLPTVDTAASLSRPLWSVANFRHLWLAGLVSQVGDRIHQVALLWWATEQTHSAAVAGTLLMVSTLPLVLFSPLAGWLADHWGRRPVMVLADLLRLVVAGLMAVLLWSDRLTIPSAIGLSLVLAVGGALFNPASMAILPDVVDEAELPQANSWLELTMQVTGIVGPALGGVAVALYGTATSLAANAGTFALSAVLLALLRLRPMPVGDGESMLAGMRQVLGFLRSQPSIAWLLASFGVLNFFGVPVLVYIPYFANEVFRVGATGYGLLEAAPAVGMGAAALWLASSGPPGSVGRVYPLALLVQAAAYVAMGVWPSMACFLVALTAIGMALGLVNILVITHFQQVVPGEQLGRFMGLLMTVVMAMVPLSFGLAGVLTTQVVPAWVLIGSGIAMVGLSLAVRRIPALTTPVRPDS